MKTKMLALLILATGSLFAGSRVSVGVYVGGPSYGYYPPPPPPPVVVYETPCPGPGYTYVTGYWEYEGPRRCWRRGYWAPPSRHYDKHHWKREREYRRWRDRDHDRRDYDRRGRGRGRW